MFSPSSAFVVFLTLFNIPSHHGGIQKLGDTGHTQDKEHLKEHLKGMDVKSMAQEELRFHYFYSHDFDSNKKLDGLEILQAFTHYDHGHDTVLQHVVFDDQDFVEAIDQVINPRFDKNQDGFLDYEEYMTAQKTLW